MKLDTVHLGDCLEWLKGLPDGCCDAILTDPPYNVGLKYDQWHDAHDGYHEWCLEWFTECRRVAPLVAFTPGTPNLHMWLDIAEPDIIMASVKPNGHGYSKVGFTWWEPILVYGKPQGTRIPDTIIVSLVHQAECEPHPCPKPTALYRRLLEGLTKRGAVVGEPFAGSGSLLVACVETDRHFLACELSPTYHAICERRIAEARARPRLPGLEPKPEQFSMETADVG